VSLTVSDHNDRLESRALAGAGLPLDGLDLHDLVLELVLEEVVDDLGLLDRKRMEVDFFYGGDVAAENKSSELRLGLPTFLPLLIATAARATASATTTPTTATAIPGPAAAPLARPSSAYTAAAAFAWGFRRSSRH
jgi:hypothetical protein